MRIFVALDLPEPVLDELEVMQADLSVGREVPRENLHLTLCFLGDQSDDAAEAAHLALSRIRGDVLDLQLSGIGTFGKRTPHVIYAALAKNPLLSDLQRRVTSALRGTGVDFPRQRFRPHVTLARLPAALPLIDAQRLEAFIASHVGYRGEVFRVTEFGLYRSVLTRRTAIHERLAGYSLGLEE